MVIDGIIKDVIIRPGATTEGAASDISALKYTAYGPADITFAINLKQSSDAGRPTKNETTVIISSSIEQMKFDMGGDVIMDENNSSGIITLITVC